LASAVAMAKPIPAVEPVTRAVLPSSRKFIRIGASRSLQLQPPLNFQ
jgi:hypothetical protein